MRRKAITKTINRYFSSSPILFKNGNEKHRKKNQVGPNWKNKVGRIR